MTKKAIIILILTITALPLGGLEGQAGKIRRFALIVGNNNGGRGMEKLTYAAKDAMNVSELMTSIGGTREEEVLFIKNPEAIMLDSSFDNLASLMREETLPGERAEVLFYYSGHSDSENLLLSSGKYPYSKLEKKIADLPGGMKIVILDSCASGGLIRSKGGRFIHPFLVDNANISRGRAYLTSCTEEEQSHESDKIGASFFTYTLVSGLRGAADSNNDGNVTLNEVYQYAYNETTRHAGEAAKTQHPSYKLNLEGTGNLVLTNIKQNTSLFVMDKQLSGRVLMRDEGENLILEFFKKPKKVMEICLPPGNYSLDFHSGDKVYSESFTLGYDSVYRMTSTKEMIQQPRSSSRNKGSSPSRMALSVEGGVGLPLGEEGARFDPGLNFSGGFHFFHTLGNSLLGIGGYGGLGGQRTGSDYSKPYELLSMPIGVSLKWTVPLGSFKIYGEIGGGAMVCVQTISEEREASLWPHVSASGGINFPLGEMIRLGGCGRFTKTFLLNNDSSLTGFIPALNIEINM